MRRLAAACIMFVISGQARGVEWAPDPAAIQTLARGHAWSEVAPSTDGANIIRGVIDIPAPPKTVWSVVTDCALAKRLVSNLVSCKTLEGGLAQGWSVRESITRLGFFLPTVRNVARNDYQPYTLIRFHRVGGDLRIQEGEWRLQPLPGGRTRVIYENRVATTMPVPASLMRGMIRHDTLKILENLRRESIAASRG